MTCFQVWLVLKQGFLAFLENHFEAKLLDIIIFDTLPASNAKGHDEVYLARVLKQRNPLCHAFQVCIFSHSSKFLMDVIACERYKAIFFKTSLEILSLLLYHAFFNLIISFLMSKIVLTHFGILIYFKLIT